MEKAADGDPPCPDMDSSALSDGNTQRVVNAELGEMMELSSMCPRCENTAGQTRLMITKIPHFREVIVSSFECSSCGEKNNFVQFGGEFGPKKVRYALTVSTQKDLDRQVVKSEYATVRIPEVELEIPPQSQCGILNTVEGILSRTIDGLSEMQKERHEVDPTNASKIDLFIEQLKRYMIGQDLPFTLLLDDPSGNSYIESIHEYYHPTLDSNLTKHEQDRTDIDRQLLGLSIEYNHQRPAAVEEDVERGSLPDVLQLDTQCSACSQPGTMRMHQCDIPHFHETIIMAFKCDYCGYKSNEIKCGGAVPSMGKRITLHVQTTHDLKRDVLKSNSASLTIPEVELELSEGTLGGFFSTVEGVLVQVRDQLKSLPQAHFEVGDSAAVNEIFHSGSRLESGNSGMSHFLERLEKLIDGSVPFTMILDDPLGAIYVQNPKAHLPPPECEDPQMVVEEYVRTFEQDEDLGFHQMQLN